MANFTQKAIVRVFMQLLHEKPLDKITVSDITDACGLNRNTFYYHYHDIYDLVDAIFREETERMLAADPDFSSWQEGFMQATRFARENRVVIMNIYHSVSRDRLETFLFDVSRSGMRRYVEFRAEGLGVSQRDIDDLTLLGAAALEGLILDWLRDGMASDPEAYIANIGRLLDGGFNRIFEQATR